MADPLSMASAIAGLVTLVDMVFVRAFRYVNEVKSAEKSVNDLVKLLQSMCGTLHMLRQRLHVLDEHNTNPNLQLLPPILQDCSQLLADVDMKLEKYHKRGSGKVASTLRKLQWPFDVSSTNQLVDQLTRFNDVLNTALNANTMLAVHESLKKADDLLDGIKRLERSLSIKHNHFLSMELSREQREAMKFFQSCDPSERHKVACRLWQRGTGKWFTDGQECSSWLQGQTPKLWLSGIPGAGKTVLASAIIEKARKICYSATDDIALAYFYCDYKDPDTHDIDKILSSLAAQIASHGKEAMKLFVEHYQKFCQPGRKQSLETPPTLAELIHQIAANFDKVILIVDGLDECGKKVQKVTSELNELASQQGGNFNVLFLSRREQEILSVLGVEYTHISIAASSPDLRLYVAAEMARRTSDGRLIIDDVDVKAKIIEQLVNKADGMFRWVACQIDYLCDLATDSERESALSELPPDLFSSYDRILDRVNQKGPSIQKLVQRALKWTIYAYPPLTIPALCEALSIDEGQTRHEKTRIPSETTILRHCSSLVRKPAGSFCIEPAHFTVKEYLERLDPDDPKLTKYRLSENKSYLGFAQTCLTYLTFSDFSRIESVTNIDQRRQNHPFHRHAVERWSHYAQQHWVDEPLQKQCQQFLRPGRNGNFLSWVYDYTYPNLSESQRLLQSSQLISNLTPLHAAALLSIPPLVPWLVDLGQEVNADSTFGSPLQCALLGSDAFGISEIDGLPEIELGVLTSPTHISTLQALIDSGADVSQQYRVEKSGKFLSSIFLLCYHFSSTLEELCSSIKVLLTAGAKLDAFTGEQTAFTELFESHSALRQCFELRNVHADYHAEFLDSIRRCDEGDIGKNSSDTILADFNVGSFDAEILASTLRLAANQADVALLKLVLSNPGVDINAKDSNGVTALHIAAEKNDAEAVSLLVHRGANINAVDERGNTPLHYCSKWTDTKVATVLVREGATESLNLRYHDSQWEIAAEFQNTAFLMVPISVYEGSEEQLCEMLASSTGPLFAAAKCGMNTVVESIASSTRRTNISDEHGRNLAHYAGKLGTDCLRSLIQRGLDVTKVDHTGRNALHVIAASHLLWEISPLSIELLIANGCKRDLYVPWHGTPLDELLHNSLFWSESRSSTAKRTELVRLLCVHSIEGLKEGDQRKFAINRLSENWGEKDFIEVFNCVISDGAKSEPSIASLVFTRMLEVLATTPYPQDILQKGFAHLGEVFATLPDPAGLVASPIAQKAAILSIQSGYMDLPLRLIKNGVSMTSKVADAGNRSILESLAVYHVDAAMLKEMLALVSEADLGLRYGPSYTLLHIICQNEKFTKAHSSAIDVFLERGCELDAVSESGHTPLILAAEHGRLECVQVLVSKGADVQKRNFRGYSAFHFACLGPRTDMAGYLISHCGTSLSWDVTVNISLRLPPNSHRNVDGCTVLHLAIANKQTLALLLSKHPKPDVNVKSATMLTPLHLASHTGNMDSVRFLLDSGADVEAQDKDGLTALHHSVMMNRVEIMQALLRGGAKIDAMTKSGGTALHYAAFNSGNWAAQCLIENGATLKRDNSGLTPDMIALKKGNSYLAVLLQNHREKERQATTSTDQNQQKVTHRPLRGVFRALMDAIVAGDGASVRNLTIVDSSRSSPRCAGCSPVQLAIDRAQWDILKDLLAQGYPARSVGCPTSSLPGLTPIHLASLSPSSVGSLQHLLSLHDMNDMQRPFSIHPLHLAVAGGGVGVLKILLRHYSDGLHQKPFTPDHFVMSQTQPLPNSLQAHFRGIAPGFLYGTPLHIAAALNRVEAAQELLQYGSQVDASTQGPPWTPLHYAAAHGAQEMVHLLLDHGAHIEARSQQGLSPLFIAMSHHKPATVQVLLERGASIKLDDVQWLCRTTLLSQASVASMSLQEPISTATLTDFQRAVRGLWTTGMIRLLFNWGMWHQKDFTIPADSLSRQIYGEGSRNLKTVLRWLKHYQLLDAQLNYTSPSPLCIAAQRGELIVIEMLLSAGAEIDGIGCDHGSALMLACAIGRFDVVKQLVRRGASLTSKSRVGKLDNAVQRATKFEKVQRWLLVDRWVDQRRICASDRESASKGMTVKSWSGPQEVKELLDLCFKQYTYETMLQWHIRKRNMLKWFEGKVLFYPPRAKYVFANQ